MRNLLLLLIKDPKGFVKIIIFIIIIQSNTIYLLTQEIVSNGTKNVGKPALTMAHEAGNRCKLIKCKTRLQLRVKRNRNSQISA